MPREPHSASELHSSAAERAHEHPACDAAPELLDPNDIQHQPRRPPGWITPKQP
jgi:hypothetical protein